MSQSAALRALDQSCRAAIAHVGLDNAATYTPYGGGGAVPCTILIDRGTSLGGPDGSLITNRVTVTAYYSDITSRPRAGALFDVTDTGEQFKVDQILNSDESRVVCLVV